MTDQPPSATRTAPSRGLLLLPPLVFLILLGHTAWDKSPTWDEPGYLGLGAYLLAEGRFDVPGGGSHPPLSYYVQSLPYLLPKYELALQRWQYPDDIERDLSFVRSADTDRGNGILMTPGVDGELFLWLTRMTSVFAAALLLACVWSWSRQLFGDAAALLSLSLAALSPNLLAHAGLVTTDFTTAATYIGAFYVLRRFLLQPTHAAWLLAGIAGGLALASKLSALMWGPTVALLLAWTAWLGPVDTRAWLARLAPTGPTSLRPWLGAAAVGVGLAVGSLATLWALYGFRVDPYLTVAGSQLFDLSSGHSAYLLGEFSTQGWWYYFPVAFLSKTPLPTLVLLAWALLGLGRDRDRCWQTGLLLAPPAVLFGAFVLAEGKDIGLRYILPVYPFLFITCGAVAAGAWSSLPRWRRHAVIGLVAAAALTTARIHPHHLAFFNEAVGGPAAGRHILVDSNLDWGQDLKGLKLFMDDRGIERIKLSYFGAADPALYDLQYEWLPSFMLPRHEDRMARLPTTGWIAVSATNLVGVYMDMYGHGKGIYRWLDAHEPVAVIGHSIHVYHIPEP